MGEGLNDKKINIVHIGTEISATSAPLRIHYAVEMAGFHSQILALRKRTDNVKVVVARLGIKDKIAIRFAYYYNKWLIKKYPRRKNIPFSFEHTGINVHREQIVKNADVIHLHWINGQFISYKEIRKLANMGKPMVWTFHDSWPMTGGCHVRYGCTKYREYCGRCPLLGSYEENDITKRVIKAKLKYYKRGSITTVSPSGWMYRNVRTSRLFGKSDNVCIGNPINLDLYKPLENRISNGKIQILFGANGALELEYKGYSYFVDALLTIKKKHPEFAKMIEINIFGTNTDKIEGLEEFQCKLLGVISSEEILASTYSMADIYVFPSIDDNLPGTVMESLACETPVVAFNTGGISDMVKHKENGYVAEYKSAESLAEGIIWVNEHNKENQLGKNGRKYIVQNYTMQKIGNEYGNLYKNLLNKC